MEIDYDIWENSEWDKKERIIEEIVENCGYDVLSETLQNCKEAYIRSEITGLLVDYIDIPEIEKIVLDVLNDKNWIVRSDAYDILRYSDSAKTLDILLKRISKEGSKNARAYLVSAIGTICYNNEDLAKSIDISKMIEKYKREDGAAVLIAYDVLLYVLTGDTDYICDSLKYLSHKDYKIRCSVINLMEEGIDENTCGLIYKAYNERLFVEDSRAVMCSLIEKIKYLEEEFRI